MTDIAVWMESFIWHWVMLSVILFVGIANAASPILGIIRGVNNGAVMHALVSAFVPLYGLIYFFAAKHPVPLNNQSHSET